MATTPQTLSATVEGLTARAEALGAAVEQLAKEAHAARWSFAETGGAGGIADNAWDETGFDELEDTMTELCRQAGTAIDFSYPLAPPAWYRQRHALGCSGNGAGLPGTVSRPGSH
jgi:hypothetical protein